MLALHTVPVFGHFDEVQAYDGHETNVYIVVLLEGPSMRIDAFSNGDVNPVLGSSYSIHSVPADHAFQWKRASTSRALTHCVRGSIVIKRCHIPHVVRNFLPRHL